MINNQIKPDNSAAIQKFIEGGGRIVQAVNANKAEFNFFNADEVTKNSEKPNSHKNHILRTRAEKDGLKSYTPVVPCKSCGTSERSVKSNACLECDRRRFRAKTGMHEDKLKQVGNYLLEQNKSITFTSRGRTYTLKVEEATELTVQQKPVCNAILQSECSNKPTKLIRALGGADMAAHWIKDLADGVNYLLVAGEILTARKRNSSTFTKADLAAAIKAAGGVDDFT